MSALPRADKEQCAAFIVSNQSSRQNASDLYLRETSTFSFAGRTTWMVSSLCEYLVLVFLFSFFFSLSFFLFILILWDGSLISSFSSCQDFDDRLIKLVWRNRPTGLQSREPSMHSMGAFSDPFGSEAAIIPPDPSTASGTPPLMDKEGNLSKPEEHAPAKSLFGWRSAKPRTQAADPEKDMQKNRPTKLIAPIYNGLGVAVALCAYHLGPYSICH